MEIIAATAGINASRKRSWRVNQIVEEAVASVYAVIVTSALTPIASRISCSLTIPTV